MTQCLRTIAVTAIVLLTTASVRAQTPLGGVINAYTPVTEIINADCASHLRVGSSTEFNVNDLVLIIQMKGALQSGQYATSTVGLFEFATVASINGSVIDLAFILLNPYDVNGRVQLVRVPQYLSAEVNMPVTGKQWDGSSGGVITLDVATSLTLNANITANGIGFRGGSTWRSGTTCSILVANDGANSQSAAMKGETFVDPIAQNVSGRQELFSGGGGGVAHNSGGGGGGNGGAGGKGGSQWDGCGRFFDNGGLGGRSASALINNTSRLRCGGGGGAGQMNDNTGTGGANGGGIVIIRCATLVGNANRITANGMTPVADASHDGAGAGGAGGTVLLFAPTVLAGVFVDADGGGGGNVRTSNLHGPGGGGGAGTFMFSNASPVAGLVFSVTGAPNGRNVNQTDPVNQAYLATRGDDGQSAFGVLIPQNRGQYPRLTVAAPADTTVCPGTTLSFRAKTTGTYSRIEWTQGDGAIISTRSDVSVIASTSQAYVVSITDVNGCTFKDSVNVDVNTGVKMTFASVDTTLPPCSSMTGIDTAIWLFNNSASNATITKVASAQPGVAITLAEPVPIVMRPGDRVRVGVAIALNPASVGATTARIDVTVSPCDTVITAGITVQRNERIFTVDPTTVVMKSIIGCTATMRDTMVAMLFGDPAHDVVDVLELGTIQLLSAKRFRTSPGIRVPVSLRWAPALGVTAGRLGFVVRDGACIDTVWVGIDGLVSSPTISSAQIIDVNTLVLCKNSRSNIDVIFTSADTTSWTIGEVAISGPATTDITSGTSFVGQHIGSVTVTPLQVGPYEVVLSARLLPCDTVIAVTIRGNAVNVQHDGTPVLAFTERIIGRRQMLQSSYRNTGTVDVHVLTVAAPSPPFTLLRTNPSVPCTLAPGDQLTADVDILQRFGVHSDSLIVTIDAPCVGALATQLKGEASALSIISMPYIKSRLGTLDTIPILLNQRPEIDSVLLDEFVVSVEWEARGLSISSGRDSRASWGVQNVGDKFVVDIIGRWNGSDTLALLPVIPLLWYTPSTDLVFDRSPGFIWTGQPCNIEYDDGSIIVDDPCAGRNRRIVLFTGIGALTIAPMPVHETLILRLDDDRTHAISVYITDVTGRSVHASTAWLHREWRLDVGALSSGIYILRININGDLQTMQFYCE